MEVVLSPGRFGDEAAGTPFQNEEIREWSHVDRLTGMLERARVETGRWQTSNQGAARSYGKVIDSRERNSADGSVVQRARRQVEVFQSQGPGRSVQVVRASQWSSSRVTDSTIAGPRAIASSTRKEEKPSSRLASLCGLSPSSSSSLCRDEAISERLSSLLGSFAYSASSTVPLRRIDSRYASRTPISLTTSKRCTSNENVSTAIHDENNIDPLAVAKSLRESGSSGGSDDIELIPGEEDFHGKQIVAKNVRLHAITVEREESPCSFPARSEISDSDKINEKKSQVSSSEEIRPAASKAAIHLLPSSKANTTVVNLMNSGHSPPWLLSSLQAETESRSCESKIAESPRGRNEDSTMPSSAGRVKRVGFCKTEIHFAADSGKVNIVETDGKPPPTNKFRRRRRNNLSNKNAVIANRQATSYNEALTKNLAPADVPTVEDKTNKNDPNLHRGHTTTVNLGTDFSVENEISDRDERQRRNRRVEHPGILETSSQGILLRLENRIYDRLDCCSSQLPRDSSSTTMSVQQSSLKSARLVLNITRNPSPGSASKFFIDNEKKSAVATFPTVLNLKEDDTTNNLEEDDKYLDWVADNEVKCIMLGTASLDNRDVEDEFTPDPPKEMEFIDANRGSPRIGTEQSSRVIDPSGKESSSFRQSTVSSGSPLKSEKENRANENYDVLCTDAENNQVLLKVVTTHEPTIARVERDHLRKKTIIGKNLPTASKKESRPTICKTAKSEARQKEHTYVNIFTGSKRAPIYENYKISENSKNSIKSSSKNNEAQPTPEKIYLNAKSQSLASATKEAKSTDEPEKIGSIVEAKANSVESPENLSKKVRNRTKEMKLLAKIKSSSSSNSTNSGVPRGRSSSNGVAIPSSDRGSRTSGGSANGIKSNGSKSGSKDVVVSAKAIKKNEGTTRQKPEVVYQTAVYNMKNERLSRPTKGKESKGPRYLNELICGAKTKRASDSKNKTSSSTQNAEKGAPQTIKHWK